MDQQVDISMEITRADHKLSSVSVIMPTWNRKGSDGKLYASIPFLGLETCGVDEDDLEVAVKEAFICFCLAAEEYGLGLESELEFLGWTQVEERSDTHSILNNFPSNKGIEAALSTGDTRLITLDSFPPILQAA